MDSQREQITDRDRAVRRAGALRRTLVGSAAAGSLGIAAVLGHRGPRWQLHHGAEQHRRATNSPTGSTGGSGTSPTTTSSGHRFSDDGGSSDDNGSSDDGAGNASSGTAPTAGEHHQQRPERAVAVERQRQQPRHLERLLR